MAEYIKREAMIDLITRRYENPEICTQEINSIPVADVAPVVRCRDCAHLFGTLCTVCGLLPRQPDDFCSRGERKDEANES